MNLSQALNWSVPPDWQKIQTIDMHTAGEPLRVILGGFPEVKGATILQCRQYVKDNWDSIRRALMWEPRGHADMYGCLITPPLSPEAHFGTFFLHNEGYSTMCGHAIIALSTLAVKVGWVPIQEPFSEVNIDTPAGLVRSRAFIEKGELTRVAFENVASFVYELNASVRLPDGQLIPYDLAFGGAYYAYVQADSIGLSLDKDNTPEIIRMGKMIKKAVMSQREIIHPGEAKELGFLYGTIFIGKPEDPRHHSRNVCVFAAGEVDRSPTGTGVSGRLAIHHARKELGLSQTIEIESIIGTTFEGQVLRECRLKPFDAIVPEVSGTAYITGRHEFMLDPNDPLKDGFLLR